MSDYVSMLSIYQMTFLTLSEFASVHETNINSNLLKNVKISSSNYLLLSIISACDNSFKHI